MNATATACALVLDGLTLRSPSGAELATWDGSGWRTPHGALVRELQLTVPVVAALVTDDAQRAADRAWLEASIIDLRRLAAERDLFTSDDVWSALSFPPRQSRMIGNLLTRAQAAGICEPTDQHQPSTRGINHGRPVRVWRSCPAIF